LKLYSEGPEQNPAWDSSVSDTTYSLLSCPICSFSGQRVCFEIYGFKVDFSASSEKQQKIRPRVPRSIMLETYPKSNISTNFGLSSSIHKKIIGKKLQKLSKMHF